MSQLSYPHVFFFLIKCCWIKVFWSRYNFPLSLRAAILLTKSDLTMLTQLAIAWIDPGFFGRGQNLNKFEKIISTAKDRNKNWLFSNFLKHAFKKWNFFWKNMSGRDLSPIPTPLLMYNNNFALLPIRPFWYFSVIGMKIDNWKHSGWWLLGNLVTWPNHLE